jgi:hypothetical protein
VAKAGEEVEEESDLHNYSFDVVGQFKIYVYVLPKLQIFDRF